MVVATALTKPDDLAFPFGHWTLDGLEVDLNEEKGIAIKRSRINEILLAEGLRWRQDERWFGERVDPDFAQKRGVLATWDICSLTSPLQRVTPAKKFENRQASAQ